MAKILAIIGLGMPASLLFTAQVAVGIRALCQTQVEPAAAAAAAAALQPRAPRGLGSPTLWVLGFTLCHI